jgi:enamine deaminase RidA (YjgF/YER057c/UK114 family)
MTDARLCLNPDSLSPPTGAPETPFYSWVVRRGPMVFLAGMSPYAADKTLIGTTLGEQTEQCFRNMAAAMESIGGSIGDVCSITVYVQATDLQRDVYPEVNPVVHKVFGMAPPARVVIGGVALPRPTELVLIAATAVMPG